MLLPVIALISYSAMALLPVLNRENQKIAENATDYSINNTAACPLAAGGHDLNFSANRPSIRSMYASATAQP